MPRQHLMCLVNVVTGGSYSRWMYNLTPDWWSVRLYIEPENGSPVTHLSMGTTFRKEDNCQSLDPKLAMCYSLCIKCLACQSSWVVMRLNSVCLRTSWKRWSTSVTGYPSSEKTLLMKTFESRLGETLMALKTIGIDNHGMWTLPGRNMKILSTG